MPRKRRRATAVLSNIPGNSRIGVNWMSTLLNYMAVVYIIIGAAVTVTILACCKVSGDCSRQEEKEQRGKQ